MVKQTKARQQQNKTAKFQPKPEDKTMLNTSIWLPRETIDALHAWADESQVKYSTLIRQLIEHMLQERGK